MRGDEGGASLAGEGVRGRGGARIGACLSSHCGGKHHCGCVLVQSGRGWRMIGRQGSTE